MPERGWNWLPHPRRWEVDIDYRTLLASYYVPGGQLRPRAPFKTPEIRVRINPFEREKLIEPLPDMTLEQLRLVLLENLEYYRDARDLDLVWMEYGPHRERRIDPETSAKSWVRSDDWVATVEFMLEGLEGLRPTAKLPNFLADARRRSKARGDG